MSGSEAPITLREAAARSGVSINVLRRHIREGTLAATKANGRYEVAVADLDALPAKLQQMQQEHKEADRAELEAIAAKKVREWPPLSEARKKELGMLIAGGPLPRAKDTDRGTPRS